MKKRLLSLLLSVFTVFTTFAQTPTAPAPQTLFNLDFQELYSNGYLQRWTNARPGKYIRKVDKSEKTLKISCQDNAKKGSDTFETGAPIEYLKGARKLAFKAQVKENGKDGKGEAYLYVKFMDNHRGVIMKSFTASQKVKGGNQWQEVSVEMDILDSYSFIKFGGVYSGNSQAWFRNLELYLDGKKFDDVASFVKEPTQEEIDWLKKYMYPLSTSNPSRKDVSDLEPLRQLLANAPVVALGEATHGTHEVFDMKVRLVEYMVEHLGYDIFVIESSFAPCEYVNRYVLYGEGSALEALQRTGWMYPEILDMVRWMRKYNTSHEKKVRFMGFDVRHGGSVAMLKELFAADAEALAFIEEYDNALNMYRRVPSARSGLDGKISQMVVQLEKMIDATVKDDYMRRWYRQVAQQGKMSINPNTVSLEESMADNLVWIRNNNPGSKIIVWAHNHHLKKRDNVMGRFVKEKLGNDYYVIGTTINRGTVYVTAESGRKEHNLEPGYAGTFEYYFYKTDVPMFLFDVRSAMNDASPCGDWLRRPTPTRHLAQMMDIPSFHYGYFTEQYDYVVFMDKTTATVPIRK